MLNIKKFYYLIPLSEKLAISFTCLIASSNSVSGSEEILFLKLFKISILFFPPSQPK
ncbi:MAG: hypothetical protein Ct9H300mP5_1550 [Candidatus Pelagibacterales bacterium]|nr:MAG: hypothetical protein Ct9H300mP5_1550 [Pelagibacterales bacterium]